MTSKCKKHVFKTNPFNPLNFQNFKILIYLLHPKKAEKDFPLLIHSLNIWYNYDHIRHKVKANIIIRISQGLQYLVIWAISLADLLARELYSVVELEFHPRHSAMGCLHPKWLLCWLAPNAHTTIHFTHNIGSTVTMDSKGLSVTQLFQKPHGLIWCICKCIYTVYIHIFVKSK